MKSANHTTYADLDLVLFDFAEAYRHQPRQATYALQALLLDPNACHARIAFLERLAELRSREFPGRPAVHPGGGFAGEIRTMIEMGTSRALEQGLLDPDRLDALSRDPDALRRAHLALVTDPTPQAARPCRATERSGFTMLAAGGRWQELADRLLPYLPAVLRAVGLDEALANRLSTFLLERARAGEMAGRRFRELLPGWLEEFAECSGLGPLPRPLRQDDWGSIIERGAVRVVLELEPDDEPDWAQGFRKLALRSRVESRQDLLRLRLPETVSRLPALAGFRRDLVAQVQQEREQAYHLFELN